MKRLFENIDVKEFFASISDSKFIAELYAKGLKDNNAIMAITAQNELVRRGDTDYVVEELNAALEGKFIKVDTVFSQLLSTSLINEGRLDPMLRRIGILLGDESNVISEEEKQELTEKSILTETLRKLINNHGYTDTEFYAMVDELFEEIG